MSSYQEEKNRKFAEHYGRLPSVPFKPSGHWIVVERDPDKDVSKGGVAFSQRSALKMSRGRVIAIGWGVVSQQTGELIRVNPNIHVGDIVQWQAPDNDPTKPAHLRTPDVSHDIEVQDKIYTFVPAGNIVLVEIPPEFKEHAPVLGEAGA